MRVQYNILGGGYYSEFYADISRCEYYWTRLAPLLKTKDNKFISYVRKLVGYTYLRGE